MATIKEMIQIGGSIEGAELMAKELIKKLGNNYLLDLQLLYGVQGKVDKSWDINQKALKAFPKNDRVLFNTGWHSLLQGRLLEGFKLMNTGRKNDLWGNPPINSLQPIWNGQDLKDKYLLFYCEAGFGDQIIFVRFVKNLAKLGAKVIVACDSGLAPLFARIPEVSSVVQFEAMLGVYHDYWVPSMQVPIPLKLEYPDLYGNSYIVPNPIYVNKFKNIIKSDKFKIGIRWLGRDGDDYIHRIFPPELLFDSVNNDKVQVYSLQTDLNNRSIPVPDWAIDLGPYLKTWEDTAGAISNLDLVISSCTAVPHLSAAMGVPTWVIIPSMMYFVWSYQNKSYNINPWYNSVTLFKQEKYDNWIKPFEYVKQQLKEVIK